jgi:predicted lysophospholipase L1 biosynthesis ABC-type transport system permease subunit
MFLPEAGHTSYTSGAVVTPAMTDRLEAAGLPVKFEYVAFDLSVGADVDAALGRVDESARSELMPFPPTARQEALRHTEALPAWFALTVVVLALGAAAHGLSATVRRRHREVAVLQVLGLTRGQARATVVWHALVAAGTGVVVGVPVGFAIGRTVWETVAASLPAFYRSPPVWAGVALVVPAVLAVAVALAGWPARRSAATEPALVLRTE